MTSLSMIPHSRPTLSAAEANAVADTIRSGMIGEGERVPAFEAAIAGLVGVGGGAAVSSGTAALHLALLALGVGPKDEVILPSYVCAALFHAVSMTGAKPVVADIDPQTFNLDPTSARKRLSRQTRAIIVPHLFGLPADIAPLSELGPPLVEDLAHTLTASYRGRSVGRAGRMAICSFYATKLITTGQGGMILSSDRRLLEKARALGRYDKVLKKGLKFNYQMSETAAAIGIVQAGRLKEFLDRRQALAGFYLRTLDGVRARLPLPPPDREHHFYRFVLRVSRLARNQSLLKERGIAAERPIFLPLHRWTGGRCPGADEAYRSALSIPIYPSLTDNERDRVVQALREVLV